jgi:hypothetical protein
MKQHSPTPDHALVFSKPAFSDDPETGTTVLQADSEGLREFDRRVIGQESVHLGDESPSVL